MIIYGTKPIELKTVNVPHICSNCGHNQQKIHIFRNFFSLFYIPVLPLRKNAIVHCSNCGKQSDKNAFLKELTINGKDAREAKTHLNAIIKDAKVPFSTYITTGIAFSLFAGVGAFVYYKERQSSARVASYVHNPTENVLLIVKTKEQMEGEGKNFPYFILYVPQIRDQKAVVFQWEYAFNSLRNAKKEIINVISFIFANNLEKKFTEPVLVPLSAFPEENFLYVHPVDAKLDLNLVWPED